MKYVTTIMTTLGLILFLSLIIALPVMWLWNWALVPAIDGVNPIVWKHAWGISLLFSLLFKSGISPNKD